MLATLTGGWIAGFVVLAVLLLACAAWFVLGLLAAPARGWAVANAVGASLVALLVLISWWWGSAFTTSGDYHAWNVKAGTVEQISKRIVPAGDSGIQERFVVRFKETGGLYGIDDTRASLVRPGMRVSLKCKKDYQWGVPREAHGWSCRWNQIPSEVSGA